MKTVPSVMTFDPPIDRAKADSYERDVEKETLLVTFTVPGFVDFPALRGSPSTPVANTSFTTFADWEAADRVLSPTALSDGIRRMRQTCCTSVEVRAFAPSPFFERPITVADL